jgi:hypothetical protein
MEHDMEAKHTPGPWNGGGGSDLIMKRSSSIAHVYAGGDFPGQTRKQTRQANARLITSAPCMHLALEAIQCGIGRIDGFEFCALGLRWNLNPYLRFDESFYQALEAEIANARANKAA